MLKLVTKNERQLLVVFFGLVVVALGLLGVRRWGLPFLQRPGASSVATSTIPTTTEQITAAFNRNDFAGAIAGADGQLARNPNDVDALLLKAGTLAQEGSLTFREKEFGAQAIAVAQQALGIDAFSSEAWRIIGYANEIMQNYREAHKDYAQALALDPHNVTAMFDDAHSYDLEGNLVAAEAGYRKALQLTPDFDQAQMGLGRVLMAKGDKKGALAAFAHAAAVSKNARLRAEATYSAGIVYQSQDDTATAEKYMNAATALDPSYPLGWAGLGTVLFAKAMSTTSPLSNADSLAAVQASLADLDKAIKLNPNQTIAHIQFATEFALIGQGEQAIQILEKTKAVVPNDITLSAADKAATLKRIDAIEAHIKAVQAGYAK